MKMSMILPSQGELSLVEWIKFLNDREACELRLEQIQKATNRLNEIIGYEPDLKKVESFKQAAELDQRAAAKSLHEAIEKAKSIIQQAHEDAALSASVSEQERKRLIGLAEGQEQRNRKLNEYEQSLQVREEDAAGVKASSAAELKSAKDVMQQAQALQVEYTEKLKKHSDMLEELQH